MKTNIDLGWVSSDKVLTESELIDLTGAKLPKKQAEVLKSHNIFFITRLDGKLRVCWHNVHNPQKEQINDEGFNWDYLDAS